MTYSRQTLDGVVELVVWQLLNSVSRADVMERLRALPSVAGMEFSDDDISYVYVVLRDRASRVPELVGW